MGQDERALKKGLFGYSRKTVDEALAERDEKLAALDREVQYLRDLIAEREREVEATNREADEARGRTDEALRSLTALGEQLQAIQSQAHDDAERTRQAAQADAAAVGEKVSHLVRIRDDVGRKLREALDEAIRSIGSVEDGASADEMVRRAGLEPQSPTAPPPPSPPERPSFEPPPAQSEPQAQEPEAPTESFEAASEVGAGDAPTTPAWDQITSTFEQEHPAQPVTSEYPTVEQTYEQPIAGEPETPEPEPVPQAGAEVEREGSQTPATPVETNGNGPSGQQLFEGVVRIDIGPLSDFAQLSRFEDAAAEVAGGAEVSVERFSEGRATVAVRLDHPIALITELTSRAPLDFSVRSHNGQTVVLDVAE